MNVNSILKVIRGIVRLRGASDNTLIGNVGDKLKTASFPTFQSLPSEFSSYKSSTEITLSSNITYTTLHSVSGSGYLFGSTFIVDHKKIECVIEVDGFVLFDFTGDFLGEIINKNALLDDGSRMFSVSGDEKRLYFKPLTPIRYSNSLVFKARKSGNKIKFQLHVYSEE